MMNNWPLLSIFLLIKDYYIFIYVHDIYFLLIHIFKYLATKINHEKIINSKKIQKIIIAIQNSKEYNIKMKYFTFWVNLKITSIKGKQKQ